MLVLDYVNGTDGGDYTCIAINEAGVDNDTVTLLVQPEIITQPEDQFATVNDDVVFTCIADSFPPPLYQWQRFNTTTDEFVSLPAELGGNSSILTISDVPFETFGNFHCIVTTPVINETITSDEVTLTISPETSVSIDPALEIVSNGSDITFTCTADGGPNNTFFWTRTNDSSIVAAQNNPPLNISQILSSFSSVIISDDTTLDLTSINATEDGGVYYCIVANEAGVGVNQTLLYVQPAITQQPVDQYVLSTDRFNLSCVADSFPPPKYQWEQMISGEFQELLNETNNFLEFDPVGFDGFGRYRCIASADGIEQNDTSMPALITGKLNNTMIIIIIVINILSRHTKLTILYDKIFLACICLYFHCFPFIMIILVFSLFQCHLLVVLW
jgi:hemicentin